MDTADSIVGLLRETGEKPFGQRFERESERMLRIEVDGGVWLKPGAAIAFRGELSFERLHTLAARSFFDAALRETSPLVRASGKGRLYCAHRGLHVRPIHLEGETVVVVWQDLLAFEESLSFKTTLVGHGVGVAAGGLTAVELSGHGALALAAHGDPLTLVVTRHPRLVGQPHADAQNRSQLAVVVPSWRRRAGADAVRRQRLRRRPAVRGSQPVCREVQSARADQIVGRRLTRAGSERRRRPRRE